MDDTVIVCSKHWDEVMAMNDKITSAGTSQTPDEFPAFLIGQRIEFRKDAPNCPICHKGAV